MWTFMGITGTISTELLKPAACVLMEMTDLQERLPSALCGDYYVFFPTEPPCSPEHTPKWLPGASSPVPPGLQLGPCSKTRVAGSLIIFSPAFLVPRSQKGLALTDFKGLLSASP